MLTWINPFTPLCWISCFILTKIWPFSLSSDWLRESLRVFDGSKILWRTLKSTFSPSPDAQFTSVHFSRTRMSLMVKGLYLYSVTWTKSDDMNEEEEKHFLQFVFYFLSPDYSSSDNLKCVQTEDLKPQFPIMPLNRCISLTICWTAEKHL